MNTRAKVKQKRKVHMHNCSCFLHRVTPTFELNTCHCQEGRVTCDIEILYFIFAEIQVNMRHKNTRDISRSKSLLTRTPHCITKCLQAPKLGIPESYSDRWEYFVIAVYFPLWVFRQWFGSNTIMSQNWVKHPGTDRKRAWIVFFAFRKLLYH